MAKIVCTIQRLDHFDEASFRQYYESNHAPLALQYMPFTRYARSYPVEGTGEGLGFDVIPEFWLEDPSAVGTILSGPAGKILAEDEARFFHRDRVAAAPVDEFILARPNIEMGSVRRRKLLLLRAEASRREAIRGAALDYACSFSRPGRELVVDFVTAVNEPAFPADIVVWTEASVEPPAPTGGLSLWKMIEVETAETAADKLIPVPA
jgi:uncharacterized protein (TIGR02118 family)